MKDAKLDPLTDAFVCAHRRGALSTAERAALVSLIDTAIKYASGPANAEAEERLATLGRAACDLTTKAAGHAANHRKRLRYAERRVFGAGSR